MVGALSALVAPGPPIPATRPKCMAARDISMSDLHIDTLKLKAPDFR